MGALGFNLHAGRRACRRHAIEQDGRDRRQARAVRPLHGDVKVGIGRRVNCGIHAVVARLARADREIPWQHRRQRETGDGRAGCRLQARIRTGDDSNRDTVQRTDSRLHRPAGDHHPGRSVKSFTAPSAIWIVSEILRYPGMETDTGWLPANRPDTT